MKFTVRGFSLIEFSVYLGLLSAIITISFVWLATLIGPVMKQQMNIDALVDLHIARDLIATDIRNGSNKATDWKNGTLNLLWKTGNSHVCWECRSGKLFRITGNHQQNKDRWIDKKQSVLAQGISQFSTHFDESLDGVLRVVTIKLSGQKSELTIVASPFVGRKIA